MEGGGWAAVQTWVRNAEQGTNDLQIVSADEARPGDIVTYDWGGQEDFGADGHIGFLASNVEGGKFTALEGNYQDAVLKVPREVGAGGANVKFIRISGEAPAPAAAPSAPAATPAPSAPAAAPAPAAPAAAPAADAAAPAAAPTRPRPVRPPTRPRRPAAPARRRWPRSTRPRSTWARRTSGAGRRRRPTSTAPASCSGPTPRPASSSRA